MSEIVEIDIVMKCDNNVRLDGRLSCDYKGILPSKE